MFQSEMTLGAKQRVSTVLVSLLAPLTILPGFVFGRHVSWIAAGVVLVALGLAWAMSPRKLLVRDGELEIARRAWPSERIPLISIASASAIGAVGPGTLRLFGVGGFFGSYGLFHNATLGRFRLYGTRSGEAVLLRRRGSALPIVVTPDDVAGTLASLER